MRIAKFIADAGICSRRDAEKLILQRRVKVNEQIITSPALDVNKTNLVSVDGKNITRIPNPIPKILDILQKMERFKYATAVDLRKGYYHIPLDKETQKLCTTVLPWGKYGYERLPMGIVSEPTVAIWWNVNPPLHASVHFVE